ncbi:MAG: M23 family metallopeptidase [Candidatus Omnitrophica bacterium]|nr:M23 family metallopeptidase [Candidatus Omnitrophota bacterium]
MKKVQHRYLQSYVSYFGGVEIEHDKKGSGLVSTYAYVKPLVIEGQKVKKGDVIATIYSDLLKNSQQSNLPHLDFSLSQKDGKLVDPEKTIYNNVDFLHAEPQNSLDFQIVEKKNLF